MRSIDALWVVFVDDERRVLEGIRREMKMIRPNWKCYYASSARDAIEIIHAHVEDIDVMVCDIKMPMMSGLDALRIAKQVFPRLLRVALSGHIDVYTLLGSEKVSHLHLCKPISSQRLSDKIIEAYTTRMSSKQGAKGTEDMA